jgi:hypothetical protein
MAWIQILRRRLMVVVCCAALFGVMHNVSAAKPDPPARAPMRVMFIFQEVGEEGIQAVENALTRAFLREGYTVLDRNVVAQALRRDADLLRLYEIEAAKRLGSRIGADIVIGGRSKVRVQEKAYSLLEGKKVTVSQADVGAKAVLVSSGEVLTAENAHVSKPFDPTGALALEAAAEVLATRLTKGIQDFLTRPTIDYRLLADNVSPSQSKVIEDALRKVKGTKGVQQINGREFVINVDKSEDLAFKQMLFTQPLQGSLKVTGVERKTIIVDNPQPVYRPGYGKSWAVVIGINNYQQWPKLEYSVNDAQAVERLLKRLGFDEIITLLDAEATQQRILRVLGDELYSKTEADDRVFIFYAGHGQTQDLPNGSKVGYMIPVDGDLKNYYSTAISMHQLQDLSDRLRAKHIFYAMDSCFSGLLLRLRGGPKDGASALAQTTVEARQVLTAGGEGEQVFEVGGHGLFTQILLAGLEGSADLDHDGRITASELYQFIAPRLLEASRNSQNPIFGRLGRGQGEFIFVLNR